MRCPLFNSPKKIAFLNIQGVDDWIDEKSGRPSWLLGYPYEVPFSSYPNMYAYQTARGCPYVCDQCSSLLDSRIRARIRNEYAFMKKLMDVSWDRYKGLIPLRCIGDSIERWGRLQCKAECPLSPELFDWIGIRTYEEWENVAALPDYCTDDTCRDCIETLYKQALQTCENLKTTV